MQDEKGQLVFGKVLVATALPAGRSGGMLTPTRTGVALPTCLAPMAPSPDPTADVTSFLTGALPHSGRLAKDRSRREQVDKSVGTRHEGAT